METINEQITTMQERNRERLVNILRTLPEERHSSHYYFAEAPGESGLLAKSEYLPGCAVCAAGAALVAIGITSFDQLASLTPEHNGWVATALGPALGVSKFGIARIDTQNYGYSFAQMAEWLERDLFSGQDDDTWSTWGYGIRELPDTFELP